MDIRNFFGGGAKPASKPKPVEAVISDVALDSATADNETTNSLTKSTIDTSSITEPKDGAVSSPEITSNPIESADAAEKQEIPVELQSMITWAKGESVPYLALVETFEKIGATTGRIEKENILANLFRCIILTTPSDLSTFIHLASNSVASAYENVELGIGDSLLIKAICGSTGRNKANVEEDYRREGDLGLVALSSRASQKTLSFGPPKTSTKKSSLTGKHVFEQLKKIAFTKGDKAQARKVDLIKAMMIKCVGCEAKYLIRALQGKLRIGTANQTVLVAIATAFTHTIPSVVQEQMVADRLLLKDEPLLSTCNFFIAPNKTVSNNSVKKVITTTRTLNDSDSDSDSDSNADDELDGADREEEAVIEGRESSVETLGVNDIEEDAKMETVAVDDSIVDEEICGDNFISVIEKLNIKEPAEAIKLRTQYRKLPKQERVELGVISVKKAFSECPNLNTLTNALLTTPIYALHSKCQLVPGIPIAPMLAKPTKEIGEVLRRLNGLEFTMEYKYDGERAQVHLLEDQSVKIFSRNSEDNTLKYPDLIDIVKRSLLPGVTSCVLDAEVVAYDREKGCLLPFQVLSTRKRKVDDINANGNTLDSNATMEQVILNSDNQKVKIILQVFDCLYLNNKSLLYETLKFRRSVARSCFKHVEGYFHLASGCDHVENGDTAPIEAFMTEACNAMCEGLMVKTLTSNATYEPSKRSLNWLKLKKDYINGMGVCDSVDLVVMGGYPGHGKRTNVYGAYLMGCYDADNDEFQSLCKVGTGFSDEDLKMLNDRMNKEDTLIENNKKPYNFLVGDMLITSDIQWFRPIQVWELQAADLSLSSVHRGGIHKLTAEKGDRGIGLRFPRFLRVRDDKKAEQATNVDQILDMYYSQGGTNTATDQNDDDDDYL